MTTRAGGAALCTSLPCLAADALILVRAALLLLLLLMHACRVARKHLPHAL
jgi:hypothetical protein